MKADILIGIEPLEVNMSSKASHYTMNMRLGITVNERLNLKMLVIDIYSKMISYHIWSLQDHLSKLTSNSTLELQVSKSIPTPTPYPTPSF